MPPSLVRVAGALLLLSACEPTGTGSGNAATPAPASTAVKAETVNASGGSADQNSTQNATGSQYTAKMYRDFERQLALSLVGHGTFDGENITGVRVVDKCHTVFATAKGETTIDWARAGNLAPRDVDGREINRLPSADGWHEVSVPQGELPEPVGDIANRTSGAFAQLALECDPTNR